MIHCLLDSLFKNITYSPDSPFLGILDFFLVLALWMTKHMIRKISSRIRLGPYADAHTNEISVSHVLYNVLQAIVSSRTSLLPRRSFPGSRSISSEMTIRCVAGSTLK